ncbi:MAG: transglutaminase domain-containing protein [Candidatus Gracilibacteria bacterium]|nr:transglutaminase domain-containing protein [Candidatus Gracilibacteria bacterium]
MKKKILSTIIILSILLSNASYIYATNEIQNTNLKIINSFNLFISKIEKNLSKEEQIKILKKIKNTVDTKLENNDLSENSIAILNKINLLAETQLKLINTSTDKSNSEQKKIEEEEIQKFKDLELKNANIELPGYVKLIINTERIYINTIVSENGIVEFLDNDTIKKIDFTSYNEITRLNYLFLKRKTGYIFQYNGKYILVENYELENKIPYSKATNFFKGYIYDDDYNFHEKDGVYYTYKFDKFNYTNDKYGFFINSMKIIGLNPEKLLLYEKNGKYYFVKEFTEEKLISSEIINNINNKKIFVTMVYDDKKNILKETDTEFKKLKEISANLTKGLSTDNKIKVIYNWILKNITYTNPLDLSKKEIFSGIYTYINKDGVCEGYTKLMAYMLMFSGIEDLSVIRGYVIDAQDFPNVGHAWLRIGSYYYDPTFDDPIGNTKEKDYSEYLYYKLPANLFYVNRYNFEDLPESLKTKSKNERDDIVNKNLYNLVNVYKNSNYNIMKYTLLLYNNGLSYNVTIDLNKLEQIMITYNVNGADMTFTKDGKKTYIKSIKYYEVTKDNIMLVLKTINYETKGKVLLKINNNGTYTYKLVYSMELY